LSGRIVESEGYTRLARTNIDFHYHTFPSYGDAEQVIREYSTEESYLRNLVAKVTSEKEYAEQLPLTELLKKGEEIYKLAIEDVNQKNAGKVPVLE